MNYKSVLITMLAMSSIAHAIGTKGGGHVQEGEFAAAGLSLSEKMPYLKQPYKDISEEFKKAVEETNIQCASGDKLKFLILENQMAYYIPDEKTVWLHCDRWTQEKNTDGATRTVAHEYFRVLGIEGKEYKYSKQIIPAIKTMGQAAPEYGKFEGFTELLAKFQEAQSVDDANMLGTRSHFACTLVTEKNETSTKRYVFYKEAGRGLYKHYRDTSACNIGACASYEEQAFILDSSGQLISNGPFESNGFIQTVGGNGARYDNDKITFRQISDGRLVGIVQSEQGWFRKTLRTTKIISCQRTSLSVN